MLSNVGDDDRVIKLFVDRCKNIKRSHKRAIFHGKWMFVLPSFDFGKPFFGTAVGNVFSHFCDRFFGIGNDRNIYVDVSGNRCGININMNDLRVRCKLVELAGDTVVETGSDGEQEVTVADCHVCSIGTMHSKVSDE